MKKLLHVCMLTLALLMATGSQADTVLAKGPPPLMQADLNRVLALLGETLGRALNASEGERLRRLYLGYWRRNEAAEIEAFVAMRDFARQLDSLAPAERVNPMQSFRAELLAALKEAAVTDADARWLYGIHLQTQTPRTNTKPSGVPPLLGVKAPTPPPAPVGAANALPSAAQAVAPTAMPAPANTPAAPPGGVSYTAPPGWQRQDNADATVFSTVLRPEARANHEARIFVFKPSALRGSLAATFESEWRKQFASLGASDTVAHFRSRLPGGVNAYFMGRSFDRPGKSALYVVLYLLDLGTQTQVLAATVSGGWDGVQFPAAIDGSAYQALAQTLFPLLDSVRNPTGVATGPFFQLTDVVGQWEHNDGAYGGSFVSAQTGASVGAAVRGATGSLRVSADGNYDYQFSFYAYNPGANSNVSPQGERHNGRYRFADDVLTWQPQQSLSVDPRRKLVGAGVQQTARGARRVLITVAPAGGAFKHVMWVPQWNQYDGIMTWYVQQ